MPATDIAKGQKGLSNMRGKWFYIAAIGMLFSILLINLGVMVRQEPWEDEIFAVSTGWSLAQSHGQTLSVLADYPRTGSPIPFYGPVSFYAEAFLIRTFGLSLLAWRFVCFLGFVCCIFVCAALVRVAGGDRWAQLATALTVSLSVSLAGTFPGRWDFVTSTLFLTGLLVFAVSMQKGGGAFFLMM